MQRLSLALVLACFSLLSCSTEEEPEVNPTPSEPALLTGVFLDSPVEGLIYKTNTQEGITNSAGEFQFEEGETVSFFVGAVKIGEAKGENTITPIDIAVTPNANINTSEVKNIAAFLQTFDADKEPENGIQISDEAVEAMSLTEIDFRNPIIQLLGELVMEINMNTLADLEVVFPEEATNHLAQSLELDYEMSGLEGGAFFHIVESWETRTRNVHWIHEFDSEGKISKSKAFEKYPWRPLLSYSYSDYNTNGFPEFFTGDHLRADGSSGFTLNYYFSYEENSKIESFSYSPSSMSDSDLYVWKIDAIDEERRVTEVSIFEQGTSTGSTLYEFDDLNNSNKILIYVNGTSEPKTIEELVFTEFGSLAIKKMYDGSRLTQLTNRHYREDYTPEKEVRIDYRDSLPDIKTIEFKDENGQINRIEKYAADVLFELFERLEDGSSTNTVYNIEDGSYYIEYRDANNQKYKTEYYDADGNLLSTE